MFGGPYPEHDAMSLAEKIAWSCRILFLLGADDMTNGHISARLPGSDRIQMKPYGFGFDEVTPADVVVIDLDGNQVSGPHRPHRELTIHTRIYRARPDVNCVIHAHPLFTVAMSAIEEPVIPCSHDGVFFAGGVPMLRGLPDMIVTPEQGDQVAEALGPHPAVLLQNHGVVVCGVSVELTVLMFRALERACQVQSAARSLGTIHSIGPRALEIMPTKFYERSINLFWHYFVRRVVRAGLAGGMSQGR